MRLLPWLAASAAAASNGNLILAPPASASGPERLLVLVPGANVATSYYNATAAAIHAKTEAEEDEHLPQHLAASRYVFTYAIVRRFSVLSAEGSAVASEVIERVGPAAEDMKPASSLSMMLP